MSIQSRLRQAEREKALGVSKPRAARSNPKRKDYVPKPLSVTDEALQYERLRKEQKAANPHLRNRRRMFGNPLLTQKQRASMAQQRREARQKLVEASA